MSLPQVVNVKVVYIRPTYNNLQEWMANPENLYIGRRGIVFIDGERYPPQDSFWANPYRVDRDGTREEVIELYRDYITKKLSLPGSKEKIEELRGAKYLGCWCNPERCHGDVLVELLQSSSN